MKNSECTLSKEDADDYANDIMICLQLNPTIPKNLYTK